MSFIKIPWFREQHETIEGHDNIWNYWMFKEYYDLVQSGEQAVSKDIHLLFKYLVDIVLHLDIYLDVTLTENAYNTPKKYFPHDLYPWERFLLPIIFGLRWKKNDRLVFNDYFIYMARGGGKNYFMSWVIFAVMSSINGITHYDVAISASSERQAQRSYLDIADVIENNPKLARSFDKTQKQMTHKGTKSNFKFLSSNGNTMDGQRLGLAYSDEVHAISDYTALNVMRTSLGKIPDRRSFITSTDGYTRGKVLDDYKERCDDILTGKKGVQFPEDDTRHTKTFPFMHRIDDESEARTLIGWQKSNPTIIYNEDLLQTYREEVALIDSNPELNVEFHLKRLNWVKEDTRFAVASYEEIQQTKVRDINYYREKYNLVQVSGSVDFSSTRDLTTVSLNGRYGNEFYLLQHSFITREQYNMGLINQSLLDEAIEKGKLTIVNEKIINEQHVVNWFSEQRKNDWWIDTIYIDQYKSAILTQALELAGFSVVRIPTNMLKETLVSPIVDRAFTQNEIFVGDDCLFRWAVGNVYKNITSKGVRYDKIDPQRRKTDPFSAFVAFLIGTVEDPNTNENSNFTGVVV